MHSVLIIAVGLAGALAVLVFGLTSETTAPQTIQAAVPDIQAEDEKQDFHKPPGGDFTLYRTSNCQTCHNQVKPQGEREYIETQGFEFVRLWENKVWSKHDLHNNAYHNLWTTNTKDWKEWQPGGNEEKPKPNPTAERMEANLKQSWSQKKYKADGYTVATDTDCLACHASSRIPASKATFEKGNESLFAKDEGVGCEMCHGHGNKYGGERHKFNELITKDNKSDAPPKAKAIVPWRTFPTQLKADWGMVNLRDPATATARCASCHIGNREEGRFVTHEMYAAGHPPLPPLDLLAYTREQPRHWGLPKDLSYFDWLLKTHPDQALSIYSLRAGESHVARRFAESTIAVLRSTVILTGQLADESKDQGLDFAAFDCASCHHDLKFSSDRQERGYVGKPGRPLFRPAAFALAKIVTSHAATMEGGQGFADMHKELLNAEQAMLDAFSARTFGAPTKIKVASVGLEAWSTKTLVELGKVKYNDKQTKELLARLVDATQKPIADPEVAQLLTWGIETLALDQLPAGPANKLPPPLERLEKNLKPYVVTRLREGNVYPFEVKPGDDEPGLDSVDIRIGSRMKTFNSFEFQPFKKAFLDIKPDLPK